MATKRKTTKRGKKLTTGKKMAGVRPLVKYTLPEVYVSNISLSGHGSEPPSE